MMLVLLESILRTLVKNIGRKFSEYSGTCVVLLMFVCILGRPELTNFVIDQTMQTKL